MVAIVLSHAPNRRRRAQRAEYALLKNLLDPAILYFFLGAFIGVIRSNLEIPAPVTKFLSLYLLFAIGFKGGQELNRVGFSAETGKIVGIAIFLALAIPVWSFVILRRKVNPFDSAAIAATYGSVSVVTFVAASQFVAGRGYPAGGAMTVALVLMESPAIVMAVLLATWARSRAGAGATSAAPIGIKSVLHEAFTDGSQLLLIGSFVIGYISGADGGNAMNVFVGDLFKGFLAFFLLEIGLLVARQLREMRDVTPFLIGFGVVMPPMNAMVAIGIGHLFSLNRGDLTILAVLAASASYIVVPAVVRFAIPEARPSRYFAMALGITFPFNITVGIPLYYAIASRIT